ncbi:polysaccharide pyruvyl transferase [Streptomyces sp. BSE7F]|uniref:polysaccharide pyruvyl transferase family protein n=1 Tax=Streptomyces sp. BSE7-9 TaxID=2759948 RepID=UPI000D610E5E|nr:polysaccharide pyruvyl transferase family protein [Streptomyces sp. BSE7-9]MBJ6644190.1 polysaccharide pyruvyl transferase family protein [Streptomyces sp. BSE7-9]PWE09086.1 polysaccharide pyruvyl transferase [Streptomyces sp. BSE7F]
MNHAQADDRSAVTGRRRIAFAVRTDAAGLPGTAALLRSLALAAPGVCEDVVVLHPGLPDPAFAPLRRLHPRVVARRDGGLADLLRPAGYDTVVVLTPDTVVLGDIGPLLRLRHGVGAVPRAGADDVRGGLLDGLLVVQRADLDDALLARLAAGEDPRTVLEKVLTRVDGRYDFPAARLGDDLPVPPHVAVLRFPGASGVPASGPAAEAWRRFASDDDAFRAAYCALPGEKHPELLAHLAPPLLTARPSLDLARTVAEVYRRQGRYDEAVEVLAPVVGDRLDAPRCQETLGVCLMALSRYAEAEARLLLAAASPDVAPRAYAQLARLAWILGREEDARRYALEGLDADPTDAGCHAWQVRTRPEQAETDGGGEPVAAGGQLAHVALFAEGRENAGDKVLPEAVRLCFGPDTGPRRWYAQPVHRLVDEAALEELNARRGVIVGGGGLFLPDTSPNGHSHWQWNVPDTLLERLTAPLAVFAVGYNVFDGQLYRRTRFAESLRVLVERSAFFGLRNHGSIDRVRELLPAALRDKVRYQPCPTTVARHLVPGWTDPAERADTVLVNCAYDRAGLRFGHDYGHFLGQMAFALRGLRERADVRYAAHMPADERFVDDLRRVHGLTLPVEQLYDRTNDGIRALFRTSRLVIGMRGHAGMIPFGCGTPILSLVSHPKLAYFLSDIGREEWGLSVHDRDLGPLLLERAAAVLDDHPGAVADVLAAQRPLWETTRANLAELREVFAPV